MIVVKVIDFGIGLTKKEQESIFDPFRGSLAGKQSRAMNKHGNGVGLSICKRICESLGGGIEVQSKIGHKTLFTFRMKAFKDLDSFTDRDNMPSDQTIFDTGSDTEA